MKALWGLSVSIVEHHHFDTLSSTNDWAKEKLASFTQSELTLVSADVQTKGRGQFGRSWLSQKGNLFASFCFFLDHHLCNPLSHTHVMARTLSNLLVGYGVACEIKIPNDLFVGGKKIGGILCETVPFDKSLGIIIGVGLNINMDLSTLDKIDQPATSLSNELGQTFEVRPILVELARHFQNTLKIES